MGGRVVSLALAALVAVLAWSGVAWANTITVNSTGDARDLAPGDGVCYTGNTVGRLQPECTLRAATQEANANGEADSIGFATGLRGTVVLGDRLLVDNDVPGHDLSLHGPGARKLVVSGNDTIPVLYVYRGASVEIGDITISDGSFFGDPAAGAAIGSNGTTTLTDVLVTDNTVGASSYGGGGLYNGPSGTMTVSDSTFSNNIGAPNGGSIYNEGALTLINTTVSGNQTSLRGGGIYNLGTMTVRYGTITNNDTSAGGDSGLGGGIYVSSASGSATLLGTIVAGNRAGTNGPDLSGAFTSGGYNLIGNAVGTGGFASTDQVNRNPRLGLLRNNGGPTNTHALQRGSPAIDRGYETDCPSTDQRGVRRPQNGDGKRGKRCDVGAYELKPKRR